MREIKFRAWDIKIKTMWQVEELSWCDPCFILANPGLEHMGIQDRDFRTKRVPDDIALMQYTGFKDKNDKEIYEGDILKVAYCKDNPMWEVLWHENAWQQRLMGEEIPYYVHLSSQWVIEFDEVIGNIWENPELSKPDSIDISPDRECQVCGYSGVHDTHHIDKNPDNNVTENLVTLCPTCHAEVHRRGKELNIKPVKTQSRCRRQCDI